MESNTNTYRLDQGNKEYIFTTSIIGNQLKMTCHNSSNEGNKKYSRLFTIEQLNQIDEIFNCLKTPLQASEYLDKALSDQKVCVSEENGLLKITFYITSKGITNQIDIPLEEDYSTYIQSNGNQYTQTENIQNYDINNYIGNIKSSDGQNIESLLNNAFSQNRQEVILDNKDINQYFSQTDNYNINKNIYESNNANDFNINQFLQSSNNNTMGFVDNNSNQYYQEYNITNGQNSNYNYESNQYSQSFQNNENSINNLYINQIESKPYIGHVETEENNADINAQINQFLQEKGQNDTDDLKVLSQTKVLPIQTTARVLPPIGPFTSLEGLDLHMMANMNAQKNNNIEYQTVPNAENNQNYQINQNIQNYQSEEKIESQPVLTTEHITTNTNINKITNVTKKQVSEKKGKKEEGDSEEIKKLKNQLAELEPLRKKVAEMEVLRGQLTELNSLRAQVAEFNAIKNQYKNVDSQIEKLSLENQNLKRRIEELEETNTKYEEEIKILKQNEKIYSKESQGSNVEEDKDIIYEENSQDNAVKGDIIHDTSELELLTKKINKLNQKLTLNLLYKATADSDKAAAFHAKCDDANSSIVLVETDKGKRFGGYTTCSWSGECIEKKDEEAFVFSFDKMMTYDNIPGEDAIGCYPKFGPVFLGCQIRIYDNAFTRGGTTFERGLNFDTEEDYELTGGERSFNVKEIEVYEVIKE